MQPSEKFRCHVLSIRDTPGDERLIEAVWESDPEIEITALQCGAEAMAYLHAPDRKLPNLILLAWVFNAKQMSALETLTALKADAALRPVPVIVLAEALPPEQIAELYTHQVACVLEFPTDLGGLERLLANIKNLWLNLARLPYERWASSS